MTKKLTRKHLSPGPKPVHGGYVFLKSGLISKDNRHIERYLTELRESYIRELGPAESDLSTGQTILLNQLITCSGFCRLVEEQARKTANIAFLRTDPYMRFMKHGRQLVLDLGLRPDRPEKLTYLEDVIVDHGKGT